MQRHISHSYPDGNICGNTNTYTHCNTVSYGNHHAHSNAYTHNHTDTYGNNS